MDKKNHILEQLKSGGIEISEDMAEKLLKYYEMLVSTNEHVNLTAITEFEDVIIKHFADSLAPLSKNVSRETFEGESNKTSSAKNDDDLFKTTINSLFANGAMSIIDVGTGAGFPGLPLAIALPEASVTLVDALRKRIDFLDEVIAELALANVTTSHARAEDAAKTDLRENFDICASRAVADLRVLSEYCLPFVKVGGYFISYKANECDEEVEGAKNAIKLLGGEIVSRETILLPDGVKRKLIVIKKIASTPSKYPRKAGTPSKKPL